MDSSLWGQSHRHEPPGGRQRVDRRRGTENTVLRRFSCRTSPARSQRSCRRVAAGGARAEYRNFFGETPSTLWPSRKALPSQQIDQGISARSARRARPAHRWLDGDHFPDPRRRRDARRTGRARFPPMTQLTKPSGADDGVNDGRGWSCEKISILSAFRTCSHSSTSPARPQSLESNSGDVQKTCHEGSANLA
jgi:hypothetical protein